MENYQPFTYPQIPGIEKIVTEFYEDTKTRKIECLLAVDATGKIVATNAGSETEVMVPEAAHGCFVIHSHPSLAAPLSIPDLCVINNCNLLGNMAVCSDGTISWSRGCVTPGLLGSRALYHFLDQGRYAMASMMLRTVTDDEDLSDVSFSWLVLKDLFEIGGLKDLHVRTGCDTRSLDLLKEYGFEPPREYSVLK
jgi:hypothetical protein